MRLEFIIHMGAYVCDACAQNLFQWHVSMTVRKSSVPASLYTPVPPLETVQSFGGEGEKVTFGKEKIFSILILLRFHGYLLKRYFDFQILKSSILFK